jgi:glycosyltransferase involved in cell wall biosynthesis
MFRKKTISVVIPCYNEEKGIARVLERMPDLVDEIIVVDNHCTDNTARVAERLGARVVCEPQPGYGRAYKTGFQEAHGEIIVTMDGDATYPTFAISYLLHILFEDDLDFISTRRVPIEVTKNINNIQRYFGNLFLTGAVWMLFFKIIRDSQSGMWVFRKNILPKLMITQDGMAFSEEFKIESFRHKDVRAREVPIQFRYLSRIGNSKLDLWGDGFKNLLFLFKKRFFDHRINKNREKFH